MLWHLKPKFEIAKFEIEISGIQMSGRRHPQRTHVQGRPNIIMEFQLELLLSELASLQTDIRSIWETGVGGREGIIITCGHFPVPAPRCHPFALIVATNCAGSTQLYVVQHPAWNQRHSTMLLLLICLWRHWHLGLQHKCQLSQMVPHSVWFLKNTKRKPELLRYITLPQGGYKADEMYKL